MVSRFTPSRARSFGQAISRSPGTSTNTCSPSETRTTIVLTSWCGSTPRAAAASSSERTGPCRVTSWAAPARRRPPARGPSCRHSRRAPRWPGTRRSTASRRPGPGQVGLVEPLDGEPGLLDEPRRVPGEVAAGGDPSLEPVQAVLPRGHLRVRRQAVLQHVQGASGPQHSAYLRQRRSTSGIVHSVNVDSTASYVASAACQALAVQSDPLDRHRGPGAALGGQLPAQVGRLHGVHRGDRRRVGRRGSARCRTRSPAPGRTDPRTRHGAASMIGRDERLRSAMRGTTRSDHQPTFPTIRA